MERAKQEMITLNDLENDDYINQFNHFMHIDNIFLHKNMHNTVTIVNL